MNRIGGTDLEVFPLCLGGNVFGWTADEPASFAVLDAYTGAGGNFIDTADSYPQWADGCQGGESETIIGRWLARRGRRDDVIIATKVGQSRQHPGLSPATIRSAAEASLRRLGTGHIDLYYAHEDDPATPLADTMAAFDRLVRGGKARYVAASNYSAPRLAGALARARQQVLVSFAALQVPGHGPKRGSPSLSGAPGNCARQYDAIHSTWGAGSSCTSPSWRSVRYTSQAPSTTEAVWKACSRSAP